MDLKLEGLTEREILIQIYGDMRDLKDDALRLRKTVYGNGAVGLSEKHNLLAVRVESLIRALTFIGGAIMMLVIGFLFGIFTGQIQVTFP